MGQVKYGLTECTRRARYSNGGKDKSCVVLEYWLP